MYGLVNIAQSGQGMAFVTHSIHNVRLLAPLNKTNDCTIDDIRLSGLNASNKCITHCKTHLYQIRNLHDFPISCRNNLIQSSIRNPRIRCHLPSASNPPTFLQSDYYKRSHLPYLTINSRQYHTTVNETINALVPIISKRNGTST